MIMAIRDMLGLRLIVHATNGAVARLIAATAFTMHRANVSRSILFAFPVGLGGIHSSRIALMGVSFTIMLVSVPTIAATGGESQSNYEK